MSSESLKARLAALTGDNCNCYYCRSDEHDDLVAHAPKDLAAALNVIDAFTANDRQILTTAKEWCGEYGFGDPEGCTVIWNLIEQANAALDAFEALP